jgi:hypothetical protein
MCVYLVQLLDILSSLHLELKRIIPLIKSIRDLYVLLILGIQDIKSGIRAIINSISGIIYEVICIQIRACFN